MKKFYENFLSKQEEGTAVQDNYSFDLTQRSIRYSAMEAGTYDVFIKEAVVEPKNGNRVRVDLVFDERKIFESYFRPSNMLWSAGWDKFFADNDIKNINELPGRHVSITIENNQTDSAIFSNVVSVVEIEPKLNDQTEPEPEDAA